MALYPFQNYHQQLQEELNTAFLRVLNSGWYILGTELKTFEEQFAAYCGVIHCVGVGNGYDALLLSLKCLDLPPAAEVILPSNAYIAALNAVLAVGAKPVFVEPELVTYNLSAENLQKYINPRTAAVLVVHLYGQMADMQAMKAIAGSVPIIEDFAQAQGATFLGKKAGTWGLINATSFYPTKNLGALGDAGALTTDVAAYADHARSLRNYGSVQKNWHKEVGVNSRLDELQAAFLSVKLKYMEKLIAIRQKAAQAYRKALDGCLDIIMPPLHPSAQHTYHQFVIRTKFRSELQNFLSQKSISTLVHYPTPPHLQPAMRFLGYKEGDFPISEMLSKTLLSLPLPYSEEDTVVEDCCQAVWDFARKIKQK